MIASFFVNITFEKDKLYKKVIKAQCSSCLSYSSTTKKVLNYCQNKNCHNSYLLKRKGKLLTKVDLKEIFKNNILIQSPSSLYSGERDKNFLTFRCQEDNCIEEINVPYFRAIKRTKIFCKRHTTIRYNKTKKIPYSELLIRIHSQTNLKLITTSFDYQNLTTHDHLTWECTCGKIFQRTYQNAMQHSGKYCPSCAMEDKNFTSTGETELADWLKDLGEKVEVQNKTILGTHFVDMYLPAHKLAIEYNGEYWHSFHPPDYHLAKTESAKTKGIQLLHFWEHQWKNKKSIMQSIILSKINRTKKIGARKTEIKIISFREAYEFFQTNHLQGGVLGSRVHIGLFLNAQLISCTSFGVPRNNKKYEWELFRFATLANYSVVGGFARMLNFFITNYNPQNICTYADRQISDGNIYLQNGFELVSISKPSYFYFKNGKAFHRFSFRKSKLRYIDSNLTESQIMQNEGYLKNYDCGQLFFEIKQ